MWLEVPGVVPSLASPLVLVWPAVAVIVEVKCVAEAVPIRIAGCAPYIEGVGATQDLVQVRPRVTVVVQVFHEGRHAPAEEEVGATVPIGVKVRTGIEWEVIRLIEVPIVVVVRVPEVKPAIEVGVPGVEVYVHGGRPDNARRSGLEVPVIPISPTEDR